MEQLLENSITIPGVGIKIGLDAIIGLVPVIGDVIGAALGSYLLWEARGLGLSRWQMARMIGNLGLDAALGALPVAGDLADVMFRANRRNLAIIKRHLARQDRAA